MLAIPQGSSNDWNQNQDVSHLWGQYSPEFSVPSEISPTIPAGCNITFVQVLSRHGARDPTSSKTKEYNATIRQLQKNVTSFTGQYAFLKDYVYSLGADELTSFGQQEMYDAGTAFARRYTSLVSSNVPFVRAGSESRVVKSAQNWTQGFQSAQSKYSTIPVKAVDEDDRNVTLAGAYCPAFTDGIYSEVGDDAQSTFNQIWVPAVQKRLNAQMPGANLTLSQTIDLMDLCPFETVASTGGSTLSSFCGLFTYEEWDAYNYYQTLGKFYGHGNGNPLGPSQGIGWVNELLARMTNKPVEDHTNTNSTLDSNPGMFPVGLKVYADFSHDNQITGILSALGLYNKTVMLPNTTIVGANSTEAAGYSAAWTVSFAARSYYEKMQCSGQQEELVRVLVNDRVVPLVGCGADSLGRCTFSIFVKSQSFAQSGGQWHKCFE